MSKIIKGKYYIADCEHRGDITRECEYLKEIQGIKILDTYWDGKDCGEAYIIFEFSSDIFKNVYNKLPNAFYNEDINNYVTVTQTLNEGKQIKYNDYNKKVKELYLKFLQDKVAITLFFEITPKINIYDIIVKAKKSISKYNDVVIDSYATNITDGNKFIHVLFLVPIESFDINGLRDFGTCCIANHGSWLGINRIYGQLTINSILVDKHFSLRDLYEKINNKADMLYYYKAHYYAKIELKTFSYKEYMDENNNIKKTINFDNKEYHIY